MKEELKMFEQFEIRRHFDEGEEKWVFSVIDIIKALTDQKDFKKAQSYWTTLKSRLKKEGNESVTKCDRLKMLSADGKYYATDVADTETILRLVQSVPSKKAEPVKLWLARVGSERIAEIADPEQALIRAREGWQKIGRSEKWIQQRMMGQEVRGKLTDYWQDHGVNKSKEFAILTNVIHSEWADLSVKEHKQLKNLTSQNLRDHMSEAELLFTALAEMSTRNIAESEQSSGLGDNIIVAKKGGAIAKNARKELESKVGKSIITGGNFLPPKMDSKK